VSIELPSDSQVSAVMQVGDFRGAGQLGECRLKTSAGSFWLERTGPLRLKTSAGHVTADGITGDAEISTGSGKVQIGAIEGTAVVRNTNGDTTIDAVTGDLRVRAANGDIHVDRPGAGVDAKSSNGSIRLGEVARGSVVLRAATGNLEIGVAEGTGRPGRGDHRFRAGTQPPGEGHRARRDRRDRRDTRPHLLRRCHHPPHLTPLPVRRRPREGGSPCWIALTRRRGRGAPRVSAATLGRRRTTLPTAPS
jgi:hypothetical protein